MEINGRNVNRRQFLKAAGIAGIGSVVGSKVFADSTPSTSSGQASSPQAEPNGPNQPSDKQILSVELPKRKLGKTGVEIPCLVFGVSFNAMDNQLILRKAIDWGVTTWDTSNIYENGNAELGIGKFLEKNPGMREKLFIITKASFAKNTDETEKKLHLSIERMKAGHIDLYFGVHGLSDPAMLTDKFKSWVISAKERKLIKYFGYSTHANMANCLMATSKLDWVDAVMTSYNFRLMQDQKLVDAVQACYDAGVGVIAMKSQGKEIKLQEADKKLTEHFLKRGFNENQAKLKLVLEDKNIAAVCVGRENIEHLRRNIAAALDKTELTLLDKEILGTYASQTCSGYCAGCANICDSVAAGVPVSDVMRYLMYYNSFGDVQTARQLFAQIPHQTRSILLAADYTQAELRCPQQLPIGRLMQEAADKLA
jgi:predicted aldo/keto reductase-like oxidoreductase